MKKLIAGNWKMNGDNASNASLLDAILNGLTGLDGCDILVCPPSLYVAAVAQRLNGTPIAVGAQDVSIQEKGAFTGENSAGMLRDVGASYVLVGHSERRQYHHETDTLVGEKAQAALA
jgi:triosephosphate isomerase